MAGFLSRDPRWDELRLPLWHREFPIAVCWSPKSGCTTVLKWFLQHNGVLDEAMDYSPWIHDYRAEILTQAHDYRPQCERLFTRPRADKYIIKVIREPGRRAVSSYLHFLRYSSGNSSWPAVAAVDRWKQKAGLSSQGGLSFRQFLQFIDSERRQGHPIDAHFAPQYAAIQDSKVHAYVPLETIAAGLAQLERLFRLQAVPLDKPGDSFHHNPPTRRHEWPATPATFPANINTLEILGTPTAAEFLDPETLHLVHEVYRCDFDAYKAVYPVPLACLGNPHPVDMKVYCPNGKETFDDDETTEGAPSRGDRRQVA